MGQISLPLSGIRVKTPASVSRTVKWPLQPGKELTRYGTWRKKPITLGAAGGYRVQFSSQATADGLMVQVLPGSKHQPSPQELDLKDVFVTVPLDLPKTTQE